MMTTQNIMIDIETLDTAPTAVILQIGMTVFDDAFEAQASYEYSLSVRYQAERRRTISPDTLQWWLEQPQEAQDKVLKAAFHPTAGSGMAFFCDLRDLMDNSTRLWSQGSFDFILLENLYHTINDDQSKPLPWLYYQICDSRTIMHFAAMQGIDAKAVRDEIRKDYTAHTAMDDCLIQIATLKELAHAIKTGEGR
jgi:hypothetical protein